MKTFFALSLAALFSATAHAQLRLPQLPGVQRLPGVIDRTLDRVTQPLPELLSSTTQLVDLRVTTVRDLLRRHPDVIEADPRGELIRRRELVLVSPGDAALAAAAALGLVTLREDAWPELDLREVVLRVPASLDTADALAQLRASIDSFASRGLVAVSTVFLVQPGIPGIERLRALMDIWRASRPVRRADSFAAAWALVNADLVAAGLPPQAPPPRP